MLGELCHSSAINNTVSLWWSRFHHTIYYANIVVCPSENHNIDKQLTATVINLCLLWHKQSPSQWSCSVGLDEHPNGHSVSLPQSYLRAGELLPCCKNGPKIQKMWPGSSSPGDCFLSEVFWLSNQSRLPSSPPRFSYVRREEQPPWEEHSIAWTFLSLSLLCRGIAGTYMTTAVSQMFMFMFGFLISLENKQSPTLSIHHLL